LFTSPRDTAPHTSRILPSFWSALIRITFKLYIQAESNPTCIFYARAVQTNFLLLNFHCRNILK
jgi:hypothetical protein